MGKRFVCHVGDVPANAMKECEADGGLNSVHASFEYTHPSSSPGSASPVRAHCASTSARQSSVVTNDHPGSSEKVRLLLHVS